MDTPILHVDMDAFFASIEVVRNPKLIDRPVVVGGSGKRGVVAAASYEARVFGIHSAMPSLRARSLCPDLVFLSGDHAYYREVSRRVMAIFHQFTPLVEPLSLDEAFLDVGGAERTVGVPTAIASEIRRLVSAEEGLSCSVGVAPNKFLAKLASEQAKPRVSMTGCEQGSGICVVEPGAVEAFLAPLPAEAVWGVGPRTMERLRRLGVTTVSDLAVIPKMTLVSLLGDAAGGQLWRLARGLDDRPVEPGQFVKSIGHEETFPVDLVDPASLAHELIGMVDAVATRARAAGVTGRTVNIKVRFADFTTITRASTLADGTDSSIEMADVAGEMLDRIDPSPGVRLLGVSLSGLREGSVRQLRLDELPGIGWDADERRDRLPRWREAESVVDRIRGRFGFRAIGHDVARSGRLREDPVDRQRWGPDT
jgi:DNA polymerase-4